ncbi:nitroreductase/quinone reductase family protein [Nocardia sp. alder85J]|uniref:nitroreductase/quinone reductase family protein n=1 Tax=Nocardia sp. alder85J TaxID=2862949 RepID=UPI001CD5C4D7|nr:nitroreductase/quinone reductase family protein [Nocardia sp. alder85J]MCX4091470.1 nitroreductase/quinone reductase family protein [Nocardia sp. alder85J]
MKEHSYRRMVNSVNKVIIGLQRTGIAFGPMQLLTVPGRRTGRPRTFAIAINELDGERYIFQAFPKAAWVANARAASTVTLTRGRRSATARLVEIPLPERGPLLRRLVATSPARVADIFVSSGQAEAATADAMAAAAPRIAIFRVEPA